MLRKKPSGVDPYLLKDLFSTGTKVNFINSYRGVPVCSDGKILDIDVTSASFSIPRPQLLCMRNDFFTMINHPDLPSIIRAEVTELDWKNGTVEVSHLQFVEGTAGRRLMHRVETESPIQAHLVTHHMRRKIRIEVTELSTGGLSFYIHRAFYKKKEIRVGKEIFIHYNLPDIENIYLPSISIIQKCLIRNIMPGWGNQYYRVGVKNISQTDYETYIKNYISQRQNTILKEISKICAIEASR